MKPSSRILVHLFFSLGLAASGCTGVVGDLGYEGDPEPDSEFGTFSTKDTYSSGSIVEVCRTQLGLNLREGPGTGEYIIDVMPNGSRARVLGSSSGWYRLDYDGDIGWSHGYYLCQASGSSWTGSSGSGAQSPPQGQPSLEFSSPKDWGSYSNGVQFKVSASAHVRRVSYSADGSWTFAQSSDAAGGFAVHYTFSSLGTRTITARGYDEKSKQVASRTITITVTGAGGSTGSASAGSCSGSFSNPAPGYLVTSEFGSCRDGCSRLHQGIDLGTPSGTSVRAADGGKVIFAGWASGYGYMVDIDHCGKYTTRYAHLSKFLASVGQQVARGQAVALSGNTGVGTGPHLHFEIRIGSAWGTAKNPRNYIKF